MPIFPSETHTKSCLFKRRCSKKKGVQNERFIRVLLFPEEITKMMAYLPGTGVAPLEIYSAKGSPKNGDLPRNGERDHICRRANSKKRRTTSPTTHPCILFAAARQRRAVGGGESAFCNVSQLIGEPS